MLPSSAKTCNAALAPTIIVSLYTRTELESATRLWASGRRVEGDSHAELTVYEIALTAIAFFNSTRRQKTLDAEEIIFADGESSAKNQSGAVCECP